MTEGMERYYLYKSIGVCPSCGVQSAMSGTIYCPECAAKRNERNRIYYQSHKAEKAQKRRERREKLKAAGLCTVCGKQPAVQNRTQCNRCARKDAERHKERSDAMPRVLFGDGLHCHLCGKPTERGRKLCGSCYEKSCDSLAYARTRITKTEGFYKPFLYGKRCKP